MMNKQRIVIVSHALDEAITQCALENKERFAANISVMSLQALIRDYEIFDEVTEHNSFVNWYKNDRIVLSNQTHLLLNRVLYVPNVLFHDFVDGDKVYAQRELEAYLGFSFNAFQGVGNRSPIGACVESLSLPQQWTLVHRDLGLTVPSYYWGPAYENYLQHKNNLVYSEIYNFLNWSVKARPKISDPVFCFEKPPGEPVFILSIGQQQLISSVRFISHKLERSLSKLAKAVNSRFGYFISEILCFVDDKQLRFGCINGEIIRSRHHAYFQQFVCDHLVKEFYTCLH